MRTVAGMQPVETLDLGPLAADLGRVETELRASVDHEDRFLGEVASHLVAAGGKRLRPTLTLCAAYAGRGQILELQHLFDVTRTEEAYSSAIEGKTAALFATSCRIGGMVSDVDEPTLDALTNFGHHLGMCFQVVDDVLDLTSSDEALGK